MRVLFTKLHLVPGIYQVFGVVVEITGPGPAPTVIRVYQSGQHTSPRGDPFGYRP